MVNIGTKLRDATTEDVPAIVAVQQACHEEEVAAFYAHAEQRPTYYEGPPIFIPEERLASVAKWFQNPFSRTRLAMQGSAVVGYAFANLDFSHERVIRLHSLTVLEEERNKGIGSLLLRDLEMNTDPTRPITLSVLVSNTGARRLYTRHGYEVDEKFKGIMIKRRGERA